MTAPSDTPLTDEKVRDIGLESPFVYAEFARALERQLSAVKIRREEWERQNPMGGTARMLEAMAARLRAGEPFHEVLEDFNMASLEKVSEARQKAIEECVAAVIALQCTDKEPPYRAHPGYEHFKKAADALRAMLKEKP